MSPRLIVLVAVMVGSAFATKAAPVPTDPSAAARQMDALWADLEKGEIDASRALLKLAGRPKDAVALLQRSMPPLKITPERVRELLADLGSEKADTWKRASETLEYYDPRLAIGLVDLMNEVKDETARPRLVAVLAGRPDEGASLSTPPKRAKKGIELEKYGDDSYRFVSWRGTWPAVHKAEDLNVGLNAHPVGNKRKWTRASRAVVLLEHIGTPEAVDILKNMATGHPDAHATKEAKAAVERLAGKSR